MKNLFRVILLAGDPMQLSKAIQELRKCAPEIDFEQVFGEESLREAVTERGPWDFAILDKGIPGFSTQDALEVISACDAQLPCVALSPVPAAAGFRRFFEAHAIEELVATVEMAMAPVKDASLPV